MDTIEKKYDIVIVGGGIAGLYTAYQALRRNPDRNILLLEKSVTLGGRVSTYRGPDVPVPVEDGAGRFHRGHRQLIRLLGELGLHDRIIPIGSIEETPFLRHLLDKITTFFDSRKNDQDVDLSFHDYVLGRGLVTKDEFSYIESQYGYSTELFYMNIKDMMVLMKEMRTHKFLSLQGGLSQMIESLQTKILEMGGEIHYNTHVTNITRTKNTGFLIHIANCPYQIESNHCVLAIPRKALLQLPILKPIKSKLNSICTSPLCRIYATYDTGESIWFEHLNKMATPNRLRLVIPINPKKGVIMISYSDNSYAKSWGRMNKIEIKRELTRLVQEQFPWAGKQVPRKVHVAYWEEGVGYWRPGIKHSDKLAKEIARPLGTDVSMYICGENYAPRQQWIESALSTCPHL